MTLFASATSNDTHRIAGEKGLPVISGNSLVGGWGGVEASLQIYRDSLATGTPITIHFRSTRGRPGEAHAVSLGSAGDRWSRPYLPVSVPWVAIG